MQESIVQKLSQIDNYIVDDSEQELNLNIVKVGNTIKLSVCQTKSLLISKDFIGLTNTIQNKIIDTYLLNRLHLLKHILTDDDSFNLYPDMEGNVSVMSGKNMLGVTYNRSIYWLNSLHYAEPRGVKQYHSKELDLKVGDKICLNTMLTRANGDTLLGFMFDASGRVVALFTDGDISYVMGIETFFIEFNNMEIGMLSDEFIVLLKTVINYSSNTTLESVVVSEASYNRLIGIKQEGIDLVIETIKLVKQYVDTKEVS